jgi:hypothetical protein
MSTLSNSVRSAVGIAAFVVTALAGPSVSAHETRTVVRGVTHVEKAPLVRPRLLEERGRGVLIAPGCPSCGPQAQPRSIIDWVRGQLERLIA